MTQHRHLRALTALFLFSLSLLQAAPAKFDIPSQPATTAIHVFIKQSGTKVAFVEADLKGAMARAVTGEYEPAEALTLLLKDTGCTISERKAGWFSVVRVGIRPAGIDGEIREEKSGRPVVGAKVQLAGTDRLTITDRRGRFSLENVPAGGHILLVVADGMQDTHVTDIDLVAGSRLSLSPISVRVAQSGAVQLETYSVRAKRNDVIELDPYSVEGRKEKPFTMNMDIPRTVNDVQPYYIFDSKTIDQSGAVNLEDFLKQRLTMNTVAITSSQTGAAFNTTGNTSSVNLRGLGADKTLILVNGRRMPGVSIQSSPDTQPDLNGIPVSSIERIEVLPSSASGIYGGSAVGGVVNVILKKDYVGGELRTSYRNTSNTDSGGRSVNLRYGLALEGGRTHLSIGASWSDANMLLLQDRRGLVDRGINTILTNRPAAFFNFFFNPFLGSLPNISGQGSLTTGVQLVLKDGRALNATGTHLSAGTAPGTSLAALSNQLLANAGTYDLNLPPTDQANTGLLRPFGVTPTVRSYSASLTRKMTRYLDFFADFSLNRNHSTTRYTRTTSFTVPITAPTNPFTVAVSVVAPFNSPQRDIIDSDTQSLTLGFTVKLPFSWTGEFDYTHSRNNYSFLIGSTDTTRRTADLASGALNPFVDTLLYPLNLEQYFYSSPFASSSRLDDFALRGSGPLFSLPWGTPNLTTGLEHRIGSRPTSTNDSRPPLSPAGGSITNFFARKQVTDSVYGEASVPVVKNDWLPLVHAFDFQASGRIERYTVDTGTASATYLFDGRISYSGPTLNGAPYFSRTSYDSRNYTVGFKYQPVQTVTLRVSNATAFLPPTPDQLIKNPLPSTSLSTVQDPLNGNISTQVQTISGGNPDLAPQNSKSVNAGLIWQPKWGVLSGLRLNAEYYWIRQFDAIGSLSAQNIVSLESLYPGRVTRDSATNRITLVDTSMLNLFLRSTEGWDFSADYQVKTGIGTFGLHAAESIIVHLEQQNSLALPIKEYVNFPSAGGSAKYKANATLNWERNNWAAGWTVRYFSSYKQQGAAGDPVTTGTSTIQSQGSDTIPAQIYHDIFVSYAFGKTSWPGKTWSALGSRVMNGLTVQAGATNVLNTLPPTDVFYSSNYYISPYGDARLRIYTLSLRKQF